MRVKLYILPLHAAILWNSEYDTYNKVLAEKFIIITHSNFIRYHIISYPFNHLLYIYNYIYIHIIYLIFTIFHDYMFYIMKISKNQINSNTIRNLQKHS